MWPARTQGHSDSKASQIGKMGFKARFEGELLLCLSLGPWDPGLFFLVHKDTPICSRGVGTVAQRRGRVPRVSSLGWVVLRRGWVIAFS